MLQIENLCKIYTLKKGDMKVYALNGISLDFADTGLVAIVGNSGCGKTTLLNILGGIDKPTCGDVIYNGINLSSYKESEYDYYRNYEASFIFQEYNLLNEYSVIENIKLACRLQGKTKFEIEKSAKYALTSVGIEELALRKINSLSGGQQQKVAIARALAKDSSVILCDEPTGNLDSKTSTEIFELLREVSKTRLVIVVTHDSESANKFADRLIKLSDGKVVDDILLKEPSDKKCEVINKYRNLKHGSISFTDTLIMIKDNFLKSWFGNIFVMLLLVASIALTSIFVSLTMYNEQDALINTLKENGQGVIQIAKFIDYPREEYDPITGETYIAHGPLVFYESAEQKDLEKLQKLVGDDGAIYQSYFFNKNLQDFTDKFIYTEYTAFQFEARNFREIIAVDDFATFNMRLKYGHLPTEKNEILLYDYMANSLLFYDVFEGEMQNLIGKELHDIDTGLTLKIAGIIQSDYEIYSYIKNDNDTHDFEETYLTSLQSIYCKSELIEEIVKESAFNSVFKNYFATYEDGELLDTSIKKTKNINLDDIEFVATIDNYTQERGVVVDKQSVADILGLTEERITTEVADDFLTTYYVSGISNYYDFSLERNYLSGYSYPIIGVTENDLEDDVLNWYTPYEDDLYMANSTFRQFYLSLGQDWSANKELLNKFTFQTHDNNFYIENPNYYYEGYTDYIAYGILISDANYYLTRVQDFSQTIMIVLICVSAIGMFFFASLTIKTFSYKIGVLKSMGTKNISIAAIFGLQIILMTIIAYLISVPISYALCRV